MTAPARTPRQAERSAFIERAERAKAQGGRVHRLAAASDMTVVYVLCTPSRSQLLDDLQALDDALKQLEASE